MNGKKADQMVGCSRCHNINVMILPVKNFTSGEMDMVCPKCLTDSEMIDIRLIIQNAYEGGKGL